MAKRAVELERCLGVIEVATVPTGVRAYDALVKETPIRILAARPLSPAKYIVVFEGETEAVMRSVHRARQIAAQHMLGDLVLPQVHDQVREGMTGVRQGFPIDAVGLMQMQTVVAMILAADAAAKAAEVSLIELRMAMGLAGQAFFSMTGEVSSVEAALDAARERASSQGALVDSVLIARPDPEVARRLLKPDSPFSEFSL